jgi:hypothetical protein
MFSRAAKVHITMNRVKQEFGPWAAELTRRREALGWSRYRLAQEASAVTGRAIRTETVVRAEKCAYRTTPHRETREALEQALAAGELERG